MNARKSNKDRTQKSHGRITWRRLATWILALALASVSMDARSLTALDDEDFSSAMVELWSEEVNSWRLGERIIMIMKDSVQSKITFTSCVISKIAFELFTAPIWTYGGLFAQPDYTYNIRRSHFQIILQNLLWVVKICKYMYHHEKAPRISFQVHF